MKKTVYDFKDAVVCADLWYKPSELSLALKKCRSPACHHR